MTLLSTAMYSKVKRLVKSKNYRRYATTISPYEASPLIEHFHRVVNGEVTDDRILIIKRKTGVSVYTDITHIIKEELS